MWYFTWILGLGLALAAGIINVMWLEASYGFSDDPSSGAKQAAPPASDSQGDRHVIR
ncbi:MAG: cytochrome bd-I oxidase subunit CydX [Gammaproteobacteria bacterium]